MSGNKQLRHSERGPSKGDLRQQALVDVAGRLLASHQFAEAQISDLAREAGLSRASFYFYFASKQALLSAVIADALSGFRQLLGDQLEGAELRSPAELIAGTVRAATDLWWEHQVVLVASVELGAELHDVYDRNMGTIADMGDRTVSLLRKAGHFRDLTHEREAAELVTALILMTERNFYDLARRSAAREEFDEWRAILTTIWLRALESAE